MHRSYLYVPGDRPDRLAKAFTRGADAIIADLEDGVAAPAKPDALNAVCALLDGLTGDTSSGDLPSILVRVNSGPSMVDDITAVVRAGAGAVCLPKATSEALRECAGLLDSLEHQRSDRRVEMVRVVPLVESARGVLDAADMAAHARVPNLAIGEADLTADLGVELSPGAPELLAARSTLVIASAAAGIDPPTAPVSTDFANLESLRSETLALRRIGFGARSAIHPLQVEVINDVFTPTAAEVARAESLVSLFEASLGRGDGVCVDSDGRMVDEAVVRSARRLLSRGRPTG